MKIKIEELAGTIQEMLVDYRDEADKAVVESITEAAKSCVDELKRTSPVGTKEGVPHTYHKTWRYSNDIYKAFGEYSTKVFNRGNYQLIHLLEYGHDIVDRFGNRHGHKEGTPHIKPAEEHAIKKYETELKRRLNEIK